MKYLTETEWRRFIGGVAAKRDKALFTVMYWRGLRASEMRMIRRRHVDFGEGKIEIERLKGSSGGWYGLSEEEALALWDWMCDSKCLQAPECRVFPLTRIRVYQLFRQYAEKAGIAREKRHPHVLKHSIATHLLDKGLDIVDVKDWLGHCEIANTMVYAQVTSKRRREAERKAYGELL